MTINAKIVGVGQDFPVNVKKEREIMSQPINTSIVDLVRRQDYLDIFIDGIHRGSSSWTTAYTAYWFYSLEGMSVRIKDE